jgi:hypothetical protein
MAAVCPYYGSYNVQSGEGGGNKMADACILGPIASTKMAMEDGKLAGEDVPLYRQEH